MNSDFDRIFQIFSDKFNRTYSKITGKQKKEIAYLSPTVFGRWYYSALFPETILSPSMILTSQKENIEENGFYDFNVHFKHLNENILDFEFTKYFYSCECHPVIDDIEMLMKYISPSLMLKNMNKLENSDIKALQRKLSVSDRYYIEYLYELAGRLGLLKRIPSLFDVCIQPDNDNEFFRLTNEEKFKRIVEESYSICADGLNNEIPFDLCEVEPEMIKEYLIKPISVDDIFVELYGNSDVDLKDIWEKSEKEQLSETDAAILSTVFYVGIYFDRFFINIFGMYLRLIRPVYSFPLNFREIINALYTTITIDGERENELFMPCTSYSHTLVGKKFFNTFSDNDKKYPPIPMERILMSLEGIDILDQAARETVESEFSNVKIYKFKAILNRDKRLWKKIEMESDTSLCVAASHAFMMFMQTENTDIKIKLGSNNKVTAQYIASPKNSYYSEINTTLMDIIPIDGDTIIFGSGDKTIEMHCYDIEKPCREIIYPRITEQSNEITQLEHDMYAFE